jgi:hypothetical protein
MLISKSTGLPARNSFEIICDDDVDNYEIMTHYEEQLINGWIITEVIKHRGELRIVTLKGDY